MHPCYQKIDRLAPMLSVPGQAEVPLKQKEEDGEEAEESGSESVQLSVILGEEETVDVSDRFSILLVLLLLGLLY